MKRFLTYILCFALLLLAFYGILWGHYVIGMNKYSFELPKSKTILLLGDSQTQADIDDSICSMVHNVSLAHDGYLTMYKRLQLYVEANPQIDTIMLSLTPHTVSPVKDDFYHNFGYVEETTKHYLPYFSASEWWVLLKNDAADVFSALCTPFKYYMHPSENNIKQMGYFEVADYSHLKQDIEDGAVRLIPDSVEVDYGNDITLDYLHKIVDYCNAKALTLIGINTPVYHGEKYFDMNNYKALLASEFRDVEVWDYMNMDIDDDCRRDVNHLNRKGATMFSNELLKRLIQR